MPKSLLTLLLILVSATASAFELKSVVPYSEFRRTGAPKTGQKNTVNISLAQGEFHNGAVMIDNRGRDCFDTDFGAALVFPEKDADSKIATLPESAIRLYRMIHLGWREDSEVESTDQLYPLTNDINIGCPQGQVRYLWVEVNAGNLKPGKYTAQIEVQTIYPKWVTKTIDINVEVWPFAISPKELTLKVQTYDYGTATRDEQYNRDYREHYINTWNVRVDNTTTVNPDGTLSCFDDNGRPCETPYFSKLDSHIRLGGTDATYMFETIPFKGPWKLTDGGETPYMSDLWKKAFAIWLKEFVAYTKSRGLGYENWYWYPFDETNSDEFYNQLVYVRQLDPNIRNFVNRMPLEAKEDEAKKFLDKWESVADTWCVEYQALDYVVAKEARKRGNKSFWAYVARPAARNFDPSWYYRRCAWQGWTYGLSGVGFWSSVSYRTQYSKPAYRPSKLSPILREGTFTILRTADGRMAPTRRWSAWLDGLEDYVYLCKLKNLAEKLERSKKEDILEGLDKITSIVSEMTISLNGSKKYKRHTGKENSFMWPLDREESAKEALEFEKRREAVARQIIALTGRQ